MNTGDRMDSIRLLRTRAGWSQRELAERLGVDRTAVVKYESGSGEPSLRLAIRMADLFGVSMDELLGRKTPDPSSRPEPENPLLHPGRTQAAASPQPSASSVGRAAQNAGLPAHDAAPSPAQPAAPRPEDGDPQLLLLLHELRGLEPAARQRVADFMAGMRAQRDVEKLR